MNNRLIVADSERDANMRYATGLFVPDPFIYFETGGRKYAVLSDLEFDRARKYAEVDRVLSYSRYQERLRRGGMKNPGMAAVVACVLREFRVRAVEVPENFPVGLARKLKGIRVTPVPDPFFVNREIKSAKEVRMIAAALRMAEAGMDAAIRLLRKSRIGRDGWLYRNAQRVTSEQVRGAINAAIAARGGVAAQTIAAGGNQGCDPHETGHGPLRAHQAIILDIFPRDSATGYWGDITRTVVRGRASDRIKQMYATVLQGQNIAFDMLRSGVDGGKIHQAILDLFAREGFHTGKRGGRMQGFFHGTGHGLGLDIHELPRVSRVSSILRPGHVVTVEPGLYYPGVGGVRLEDVALIQSRGARNLTTYPKTLEI